MAQVISSQNNSLVKLASSLSSKKYRKLHNLALLEGTKIIDEAIKTNQIFYKLFIDETKTDDFKNYLHQVDCEVVYTTTKIINSISPTQTPQGIVAIIETRSFEPMVISGNFLVLDNIQDPGNLGAIIRSAAASGFKNIFMLNCVDVYNDKVIRASMGNLFKTNNYSVTIEQLQKLLSTKENYELLLATMKGENLFEVKINKNSTIGVIIGNEGSGVTRQVARLATKTVSIPMQNEVESLNAAVSASIIMYRLIN
jgi:RNA methyltransferase, TrmH family